MTELVKAKNTSGRAVCLSRGIAQPGDVMEIPRSEAIALGDHLEIEDAKETKQDTGKKANKPKSEEVLED